MARDDVAIDASRSTSSVKTGTEWYSYELIRAMLALRDRPPLVLYHREAPPAEFDVDRVRQRLVRRPRLWTHVGLSAAMLRDRPRALFVPAHVIPLVHPRASVATIHDLGYLHEPQAHTRRSWSMLDLTTRWNARVARRIIAVSAQTKSDLIDRYHIDSDKIVVVHSGVNQERFRPSNTPPDLSRLGINGPYVLFLSTVQPRKNVVRLVEAFEALCDDHLLLVIAGKRGWHSEEIEQRVGDSSVASRIILLGYVANADIPSLYAGASAFVLPSLYEGFGMGVLEAMACGCPVVTSNVSSLPEVAGDAAVLVDPHDAGSIRSGIERVLLPDVRRELIERGFRRARQFNWSDAATETLQVIQDAARAS